MADPVLTEDAVTVTVETPRETDYAALEEPNSTTAATPMMLDKPNAAEVVPTTPGAPARVQPKFSLYVCCFLGVLCSFQYGWATSQLNFALFNKKADCDRRPVKEGTCIMFPGHTKTEWTIVVNAWIVGGMFGALFIGTIADKIGRMRALQVIAVHIIVSAVLMASAYNLWQFAVGRLIAGLASGAMTGNLGSYINEVAPPHLRSNLGVIVQGGITVGILCVATTFFYLDFFDGWRIIAAFPVVLGGGFLIMSQLFMVESPVWLLLKGRREEAEKVIEHLYGKENIPAALEWMGAKPKHRPSAGHHHEKSMAYGDLLKPDLRRQFIVAICLATMQKLTGINTVFYYSSDLFSQAGLKNARVATIIVDIVSMVPTCTSGLFSTKFGARSMLLWGISAMGVSFALLTIALVYDIGWLVILSMSTYVASFGCSLGPLLWVVTAAIFPDYARAKVSSIGVMIAWLANLVVGVGYPYLSTSLEAYAYLPFIAVIVASVLFVFFFIPETSGKTTEQIQEEFRKMRKAPAMVQAVEATPEES